MAKKAPEGNQKSSSASKSATDKLKQERTDAEPLKKREMTIVGIGASAGGLKALESFFEALPNDTGLAFVVVIHLHPEHESHLAELLQSHTRMSVQQVTETVAVEADRVYVIPPNRKILIADSTLGLQEFDEPRGRRTPIDEFFRSLAEAHRESVAVILSGGGTDGAVGVKAIKQEGGLLMVQHPNEAEYDSMPRAAIATGVADVVLGVRDLARKLGEYTRHTPQIPSDPDELTEQQQDTIQRILAQVHARTGHDFSQYKRTTILRRILRRMQISGFSTLEAYLTYLRHNASEAMSMFNDILIGVTNFFRDAKSWQTLADQVFPLIFEGKGPGGSVRAWTIGCATGEEAYTLAILLSEYADALEIRPQIQVFASDLDDNSLRHAREGLYPIAVEADVSPQRLERFFQLEGNYYRVRRELRDMVLFTNHSVLRDPPFSRLELISCRNLLIYMQREMQNNVFDIFHYSLNPDGFLFLGSSETAESAQDLFSTVDKIHRIYRAKPWNRGLPHVPSLPLSIRHPPDSVLRIAPGAPRVSSVGETPLLTDQHHQALEAYGPPSVLVNEKHIILHISETAGRYLLQPKGPMTSDLLNLVRPELQPELRAALFRAFETDKAVITPPISVQFNGHSRQVIVSVRPQIQEVDPGKGQEKQALVIFLEDETASASPVMADQTEETENRAYGSVVVAQLEAEVRRLREQLQISIEEYESSHEELKASNEELQSINEEYRSATEELETSKEELQSVNEELQTVNNELKDRLEEISRAHSDLENLMHATEIAMLFLDRDLRIRHYTTGIEQIFNILPADRGRPIVHLTHNLQYDQFVQDTQQVLRDLIPMEKEVQGEIGNWYLLRMRPYRTVEDRIEGMVVTFIDITDLKQAKLDIIEGKQAEEMLRSMVDAAPDATVVVDETGRISLVNMQLERTFGFARAEVIGQPVETLIPERFHKVHTMHREQYFRGPQARPMGTGLHLYGVRKDGTEFPIEVSLSPLKTRDGTFAIASIRDVTERFDADRKIRQLAVRLTEAEQRERHRISQVLHDDLQQRLFAVQAQLSTLTDLYTSGELESLQMAVADMNEWLVESISITRTLSVNISPIILHGEGLINAVGWLSTQMQKQYSLNVAIETDNLKDEFDEGLRILLFQAVRELLFNVVKHAGTLQAAVMFELVEDHIRITISDEGRGFDPDAALNDPKMAHGLLSTRERLSLMGCSMQVFSKPGAGTRVVIDCPDLKSTG